MTDSDPRNLGDKGEIISASIAPFDHKLGWTKPLRGANLYLHWFDVLGPEHEVVDEELRAPFETMG